MSLLSTRRPIARLIRFARIARSARLARPARLTRLTRLTRVTRVAAALAPLLAASSVAHAAIRYVAPCGNDAWAGANASCTAPFGAKRTIQAALAVSNHGDEIVLLPGVYPGGIDTDGKAVTIRSIAGAYATFIDGGGMQRVITCNSLEGPNTRFEGVSIINGSAQNGAGVYIALASPTFEACIFSSNIADNDGGAVYAIASSPTFFNCEFVDNAAFGDGGAIFATTGGTILAQVCTFDDNDVDWHGGAIAAVDTTLDLDSSSFDGNTAYRGAAIWATDSEVDVALGSFFSNDAALSGGAVHAETGDVSFSLTTFSGNEATVRGGAVTALNANLLFAACTIGNSTVPGDGGLSGGGGVYVDGGTLQATTVSLSQNTAPLGGGMLINDATAALSDITTADNSAVEGGNLWLGDAAVSLTDSSVSSGLATNTGGSILAEGGGLVIEDSTIGHSTAWGHGGGLHLTGCEVVLDGIELSENTAGGEGGGAWIHVAEHLTYTTIVRDSTIEHNVATSDGGGLHILGDRVEITDSVIRFNESDLRGGGIFADAFQHDQPLLIADCDVQQNVATLWGGGAALRGGYDFVIRDGRFLGNIALAGGGGIHAYCNDGWITGTLLAGNDGFSGGAILASAATVHVSNVVGTNNSAEVRGGFARSSEFGSIRIDNATIVLNDAPEGPAFSTHEVSEVVVENSIVYGHGPAPHVGDGYFTPRYSLVPDTVEGPGCIHAEPAFVNLAGGDLRLSPGSPAIDAGLNWLLPTDASDLDTDGNLGEFLPLDRDGNPRLMDGGASGGCGVARVDLGAYEAMGAAVPIPPMADLDGNGVVNFNDLLALLAAWGNAEACALADLDGDGDVDFEDLLIVLAHWEG